MKLALALFRALMTLMPRSYGARERAEAVALTATLTRDARQRSGRLAAMRVMFAAMGDLLLHIALQRLRPLREWVFTRGLARDVHYGFRAMATRPGHSLAVIITLALGIGLNTAVFSVVDWVLLRPLPYPSAASLVRVSAADAQVASGSVSYSEAEAFSRAVSFRNSAAFSLVTRITSAPGVDPFHVTIARVTGDLFSVLGTFPTVGRAFDAHELDSGSRIVVLSDATWRTRFASAPGIVGSVITLDNQPYTVVGIMSARLAYPHAADMWRPATAEERDDDDRENVMVARLADGATPETAATELSTLHPAANAEKRVAQVDTLHTAEVRSVRGVLIWVLIGAALVLVVACANVAALIGTRGIDRAGELAIRGALGASRAELARQLLVEGILLATAGGALGVIVGVLALDALVALAPAALPRRDEITLDVRVMIVNAVVMILAGVLVSVAPARRASRTDLTTTLHAAASSRTLGHTGSRRLLVTAQIAIAVVLTVGATLLSRSLQHFVNIDHGFNPANVVTIALNVRDMTPAAARTLFLTLADDVAAIPGVQSAAVAFRLPTDLVGLRSPMRVDGVSDRDTSVAVRVITPRYFETVGIPLVSGRTLTRTDTRDGPRVGVVNRAFVREVLRGRSPLDLRIVGELVESGVTIVGVAGDVTPGGQPDRPALYLSYDQFSINAGTLVVKALNNPTALIPTLRSRIRGAAPSLPLDRVEMLDDVVAAGRAVVRFNTFVASSFGMLAFLLATIGVYGLASREVTMRRRESALRAALGASRSVIGWELLRPVALLILRAFGVGIPGAIAMSLSMRSLLHGVSPLDPLTFLLVPVVITLAASTAAVAAAWSGIRYQGSGIRRILAD